MAGRYQAIVLDIDGTLTNGDKRITPRTRDALLAAQDRGVRIVLASGRTPKGLARYARELGLYDRHGILVCYNGSHVEDCQTGEVLYERTMTCEQARAVIRRGAAFDLVAAMYRGDYLHVTDAYGGDYGPAIVPRGYHNIVQYEARENGYLVCEHRDLAAWVDWDPCKVLFVGHPDYLRAHDEEIAAPFAGQLNHMYSTPYFFEFTPLGVDKGHAIAATFAGQGIDPARCVAFGDAPNDNAMLELVGCGVAMGNADPSTKAAADMVTGTNEEDGIAQALERLGV